MTSTSIPRILYKTSPNSIIPPLVQTSFLQNELMLGVTVQHFDDHQCLQFINDYYDATILSAYMTLIPGAYKADFWRYCVLYSLGGVYGDFTQTFTQTFDLDAGNADLILTIDRPTNGMAGIQIAFMASIPHNNFFLHIIQNLVDNIRARNKGSSPLDLTGPTACHRYFSQFFSTDVYRLGIYDLNGLDGKSYRVRFALKEAGGYLEDERGLPVAVTKMEDCHQRLINSSQEHYSVLWLADKVFRSD